MSFIHDVPDMHHYPDNTFTQQSSGYIRDEKTVIISRLEKTSIQINLDSGWIKQETTKIKNICNNQLVVTEFICII